MGRFVDTKEAAMADEEGTNSTEDPKEERQLTQEDFEKMQAAYKKASREAEQYRKKAAEYEELTKSEDEKRTEKLTQAEKRAEAAERESLRLRVGLKYNLDDDLVDRLKGATLEEIEEDAKKLAEKFKTKRTAGTSFDQGGRETSPPDKSDMNNTIAGLVRGRR